MNIAIQVLDVVSATCLILALNMVAKRYKWWLFYAATNIVLTTVAVYKGLPGWAVAGVILCITGIKNYCIGRKKERDETKHNPIS